MGCRQWDGCRQRDGCGQPLACICPLPGCSSAKCIPAGGRMLPAPIPWAVPHQHSHAWVAASGENGVFADGYPAGELLGWGRLRGTSLGVASTTGLAKSQPSFDGKPRLGTWCCARGSRLSSPGDGPGREQSPCWAAWGGRGVHSSPETPVCGETPPRPGMICHRVLCVPVGLAPR